MAVLMDELYEWTAREKVSITAGEIALTQVNSILFQQYPQASSKLSVYEKIAGMNNVKVSSGVLIHDYALALWTWERGLDLVNAIIERGNVSIELNIIVNDFVLPVVSRENARTQLPLEIPPNFLKAIRDRGFSYVAGTGSFGAVSNGMVHIPLQFVFESAIRNRSRRLLKCLRRDGVTTDTNQQVLLPLWNSSLDFVSSTNAKYVTGSSLPIANGQGIPLCAGIMLAYFAARTSSVIVNIADYAWRCGYRSGAMAHFNVGSGHRPLFNLFYVHPSEGGLTFDVFRPR